MSRHPVTEGGRADVADFRQELLGRLCVRPDASDQDIEAAHNGLVEFLELAPHDVKPWAATQTANVDEAFALLSGPEQDLVAQTPIAAIDQDGRAATVQSPITAPVAPAKPVAPVAPKSRKNLFAGAIVAVIAVVVLGVWYMGRDSGVPGISGTPTSGATTAAATPTAAPLDKAKVAALMTKIAANPKDKVSLSGLGDLYFASADYKNAAVWEQKVLAIDPKNQVALLAAGAAEFNLGNSAAAKKQWVIAASLYPKNAEVHYDLGFLYMSATPPDSVNMKAEWAKVVAIDPNSQLAKTVASHVSAVPSATPSAK
jgi:tetratricopeptide (TPR) repeat protein